MLDVIKFLDKYSFVFSFIYTIIIALVGFLISKAIPTINTYKIRKCLSLKRNECKIILPSYDKKIHNNVDIIQVCPIGDIKAATNIMDLINLTGLYSNQNSIIYESTYNDIFEKYNIFCIGGSLANKYSYEIFKQFFPKFKIMATEKKVKNNPNKIPEDNFVITDSEKGFCWGDSVEEQFQIDTDERYAVIVKLTSNDFNIKHHGTVHILFGNGIEGTLAISQYLFFNYKDLYSRTKKRKHYFIAFKLKKDTGIINANSFIDLTEIMFSDTQ